MPPFKVQQAKTPSPLIIVCDHASNALPEGVGQLGLDDSVFSKHVAWDIGALKVAHMLGERLNATVISSSCSRLYVDMNRFPDSPTFIPSLSDGIEIPGNKDLNESDRQQRADDFFWPYQNAISQAVSEIAKLGQTPVVISIHSFTEALADGALRPWHIGILWNEEDDRFAAPLFSVLRKNSDICVGDNQPYHATNPHGYTVKTHAEDAGHPHALFEIRQDLIDSDEGVAKWAGVLGDALQTVLQDNHFFQQLE